MEGRGKETCIISMMSEDLGHSDMVFWDRLPARYEDSVSLCEFIVAARKSTYACVHSSPNRNCGESFWISVYESYSLTNESVNVWSLYPVIPIGTYMVSSKAI
jgi:hypothetical protein